MKILFVGFILKPDEVTSYPGASVAGNSMQLSYIKILNRLGHDIDVLSFAPIAYFPKSKRILIKSRWTDLSDEIKGYSPGFMNLPFLKIMIQSNQTKKYIASWIKKNQGIPKTIITYNANPQLATSIISYSKQDDIKTISILADPPINQLKYNKFVEFFKKREQKKTEKLLKEFNGIVALNINSIHQYTPEVPSIVIEGGVDIEDEIINQVDKVKDSKRFIYAGALTAYSGCQELLDAIKLIPRDDIEFVFYGEGPLLKNIQMCAKEDSRISYGGYLTHDEIKKAYRKADFLINPRLTDNKISEYSFSSKLFDYLLSETPVLTTLFSGLPSEYMEHINPIHTSDANALKEDILSILSLDYMILKKRAIDAKKWLLKEKNWTKQMQLLTEFIMKLHRNKKSMEESL